MLTVFDDMMADMHSNKNLNPKVIELLISGRKLSISSVFITQSYFAISKQCQTKFYGPFFMKIPNKQELQQMAFNNLSDIAFKDFMKLYKKCTVKPYTFLVNGATLASDNPLHFRKNLLERR